MKAVGEFLQGLLALLVLSPFIVIGVCIFLMVLSMSLEIVTGIKLIETYIRPIFGH
jgi:hypothetical protein